MHSAPCKKFDINDTAAYDLESVANEYGVFVDENGKGTCVKCGNSDFRLLRYRHKVRYEEWACMDCAWPGGDISDFVAWIEDIDLAEAVRYLAKRAGILK